MMKMLSKFTDFEILNCFKIVFNEIIKFKFFHFILQVLLSLGLQNPNWLLFFKTINFKV